jgi:hypothetical protein
MAYSSGGLIAATDYNNFVGTATTSGTINYVWSTGNGQYGYGQTALTQAAASAGLVTATQWATMINTMNSISTHQSGSGTGIGAPTAGSQINYLSSLSSSIATLNTNHNLANTQGSVVTGSGVAATAITATNNTTYGPTVFQTRTVTFSSGDAARYFFNAGGSINLVVTGVTNGDSTSRSTDAVNVIGTYFGGMSGFKGTTNGQRTGTGGTLSGSYTSGYWGLTTSYQTIAQVTTSSSTYSGDYVLLQAKTNGVQGSNGDNGTVISFALTYYSAHTSTTSGLYGSSGDTLNVTPTTRIDYYPPETTNLTSTWGTPTIA